jgi:hypothetical protein
MMGNCFKMTRQSTYLRKKICYQHKKWIENNWSSKKTAVTSVTMMKRYVTYLKSKSFHVLNIGLCSDLGSNHNESRAWVLKWLLMSNGSISKGWTKPLRNWRPSSWRPHKIRLEYTVEMMMWRFHRIQMFQWFAIKLPTKPSVKTELT